MAIGLGLCTLSGPLLACLGLGQDDAVQGRKAYPDMPAGRPPVLAAPGADASDAGEMQAYAQPISNLGVSFNMLPIPGGTFTLGSPDGEDDRGKGEGPQVQVHISPFWMGTCEVTWDEYALYTQKLDVVRRERGQIAATPQDAWGDAVSRPTPPYVPMDFGMGIEGHPAVCMTQLAARQYTKWLSMKTGRFYRLPTEAEWEYACRAGTTTAYSFGDDPDDIEDYGWYFDNADDQYQAVGIKKPNPWGLFDMHGNVAEWVLDGYDAQGYGALSAQTLDPLKWPVELYPRVVRGGSWDHDVEDLRSSWRGKSKAGWKVQDPQLPKSIWYHTDAAYVGFRLVRPLVEPSLAEQERYWAPVDENVREILEKQRRGER